MKNNIRRFTALFCSAVLLTAPLVFPASADEVTVLESLSLENFPLPEAGMTVGESMDAIEAQVQTTDGTRLSWAHWYKGEFYYDLYEDEKPDELRPESEFYPGYTYTCCMRIDGDLAKADGTVFAFEERGYSPVQIFINGEELPASQTSVRGEDDIFLSWTITIPGEKIPYEPMVYYTPYEITCKNGDPVTMTAEPDFPDSDGMTYSYQWYRASRQWYCTGELSSEIREPIPNANSETLDTVSDTVGTTYYFCVIEGIAEDGTVYTSASAEPRTVVCVNTEAYTFPYTDVSPDQWYYRYVEIADKNDLIDGKTPTEYVPDDDITLAECIKLAACMHQLYREKEVTLTNGADGEKWYAPYIRYAKDNRLILRDKNSRNYTEDELNSPVSRAEYVNIFGYTMPGEGWEYINDVPMGSLPDVPEDHPYAANIYKMYTAGILNGSDTKGTFHPDDPVSRSETAAILVRLLDDRYRVGAPADLQG